VLFRSQLVYNTLGKIIITTGHFGLPNLIAGKKIVPELIPYFKGHERLVNAMRPVMTDESVRAQQTAALDDVVSRFDGKTASTDAATAIYEMLETG